MNTCYIRIMTSLSGSEFSTQTALCIVTVIQTLTKSSQCEKHDWLCPWKRNQWFPTTETGNSSCRVGTCATGDWKGRFYLRSMTAWDLGHITYILSFNKLLEK